MAVIFRCYNWVPCNEAPRCPAADFDELSRVAGRGIKAELRRSLTRLRSGELPTSSRLRRDKSARFTLPSSVGLKPLAKTDHPCSPPKNCGGQGIQAKANKSLQKENWRLALFKKNRSNMYHIAALYTTVYQQKSA